MWIALNRLRIECNADFSEHSYTSLGSIGARNFLDNLRDLEAVFICISFGDFSYLFPLFL
jgi:hypothetical protein